MTNSGSGLASHAAASDRFVARALATQRAIAEAQAAHAAVLAEAHGWAREVAAALPGASSRSADLELRDLSAQLGAALRLSDRTVQLQMDAAASLTTLFPATTAAWASGEIDRAHVTVITEAGAPIVDESVREWFESRVLALAAELTAAQLRPAARTLAEHAHPESLAERHGRARRGRRVTVTDLDDGMARILADLPAVLAYGIHDRLTAIAHEVRMAEAGGRSDGSVADEDDQLGDRDERVGDSDSDSDGRVGEAGEGVDTGTRDGTIERTMDEMRADVLADLLLGGTPTAHGAGIDRIAARVQVTVPVLTVLGESREPCVLAGYGPIPIEQALRLAGATPGWDRVLTSPVDGSVLTVDRYRPSTQLRRFLRARDEHCRFVGCRQPVRRCDADHTIDHAHGGATSPENLATLCRRHHVLKHRSTWTVQQLGRGRLRWQSPAGRRYIDRPAPTVRFVSSTDPPPF